MHAPKDDKHFKTALSVILWDTLRLGDAKRLKYLGCLIYDGTELSWYCT